MKESCMIHYGSEIGLASLGVMTPTQIMPWDCGVFVARCAKYLWEGMTVPSVGFEEEYHRMRYASLFQYYGLLKAKKGYVSENEDPPRPKTHPLPDKRAIVSIE
ncbi:hypothetical protein FXO38_23380 [Capsicum annuum]|nr:hypothetical protein FXO38_23380 [Capsicum annuum]